MWLLLALPCGGCNTKYAPQIKSLESADRVKDVTTAVAAGDTRFVGVMGVGPVIPGAPEWVRERQQGNVRFIPNTSDAIESRQHEKLQRVAHDYAQKYNEILLRKVPSLATSRPVEGN
jgi:hypothetical protein